MQMNQFQNNQKFNLILDELHPSSVCSHWDFIFNNLKKYGIFNLIFNMLNNHKVVHWSDFSSLGEHNDVFLEQNEHLLDDGLAFVIYGDRRTTKHYSEKMIYGTNNYINDFYKLLKNRKKNHRNSCPSKIYEKIIFTLIRDFVFYYNFY